jgi:UDP-N-acetylmuramoyl-tripeptide--D-alanyl-D-alanine ligase
MSALWTSQNIAQATGGRASGSWSVSSADIDSRTIEQGGLFIAMPGTAHDGHKFIASAQARGAGGYLISDTSSLPSADMPYVVVSDVARALDKLGAVARLRTTARIAAITGSVGKTSVKEVTRLSLERFRPHYVHASVKSYNNHVGVPLTLARMPAHVQFGILEMGMNNSGELAVLTKLGRPHVAAITTVASAHLQNFASEQDIAHAKAEIFSGLEPGGTAIIPYDNAHYARLRAAAEKSPAGKIISFGMTGPGADVRIEKLARHSSCSCVTARINDDILTYKINQPGDHWVSNSLCVLATVQALGGDLAIAGLVLGELSGIEGRGRQMSFSIGDDGGSALVFDESYNANPASMMAALSVLGGYQPRGRGKRIAILGDMKELGNQAETLHRNLVEPVLAAEVKLIIAVGPMMAALAAALPKSVSVFQCDTAEEALSVLHAQARENDLILIKGSNSMGLGKIVTALSAAAIQKDDRG